MGPPDLAELTTQERFHERIRRFVAWKGKNRWVHHFWWFVHNCIAHPMIGIVPVRFCFRFHDYTSDKINGN